MFVSGIIGFAENVVRTSSEPVYFHTLSLITSRNFLKHMLRTQEPGVSHADDLSYIFDSEIPGIPPLGPLEDMAVRRYVKFWGNFCKYGNPTPNQDEFGLIWKPVTKEVFNYLDVDKELTLKTNPVEDRMRLWREIYKSHNNTKNFMY